MTKNVANPAIPVEVTEAQFNEFFLEHIKLGSRGPKIKIPLFRVLNYILYLLHTGCQWHKLPIQKDSNNIPEISYSQIFKHCKKWIFNGSMMKAFIASIQRLHESNQLDTSVLHGGGTCTTAKKGGDNLGYNGHKHHKGDKVVAICDRNCNIMSPFITAAGNRNESPLFPEAFASLKTVVKCLNINITNSIMSLDGVYDSAHNRKMIFNTQMIPNINENKRNRKAPKRGRKRIFSQAIYEERFRTIERVFAWEDKFKRLLLRFEFISEIHYGLKTLAYTMINLRHFCKT